MIPFMPPSAAPASPAGIKAARGADPGGAVPPAAADQCVRCDDTNAFSAWLQQLTNDRCGEGGAESLAFPEARGDLPPGRSAVELLQALIDDGATVDVASPPTILSAPTDGRTCHPLGLAVDEADDCVGPLPLSARVHQVLAAIQPSAAVPTEDGVDPAPACLVPRGAPSGDAADRAAAPTLAVHRGSTVQPIDSRPSETAVDAPIPAPTGKDTGPSTQSIHPRELPMGSADDVLAASGPRIERAVGGQPDASVQRTADEGRSFSPPWLEKKTDTGSPPEPPRTAKPKMTTPIASGLGDTDAEPSAEGPRTVRDAAHHRFALPGQAAVGEESGGEPRVSVDQNKVGTGEFQRAATAFPEAVRGVGSAAVADAGQTSASPAPEPTVKGFQAAVMDQIVQRARVRTVAGRSEILIRLKPEFLGRVQMHVTAEKQQLVVRLVTDQPVVKEIIENNLNQLKAELNHQGLTIDKFDVQVDADADPQHQRESSAHLFKQPSMPGHRRHPRGQTPETTGQDAAGDRDPDAADEDGVNYFA